MEVEGEEKTEVISLDSDDESVIVKDENVTFWYSIIWRPGNVNIKKHLMKL